MKDLVKKAGLEQVFQIASAATSIEEVGSPVYPPAWHKLAEHGIKCDGYSARQLTNRDYAGKMHLLVDFTDRPGDVVDPWYTDDFEAIWLDMSKGGQRLLRFIKKTEAQRHG